MNVPFLVSTLNSFESIDLASLSEVKLMNRFETKFLVSASRIELLLHLLAGKYKMLEIDNIKTLPYSTIYLDTPDFLFYNQHIRGMYARHKIRYRKYVSTDLSFLEIKKKSNKGRTVKWRIENNYKSGLFDESASLFIDGHSPVNSGILKTSLENSFTRLTLVGLESKERITIDYNLSYIEPDKGNKFDIPYLAIVELKRESRYANSYFTDTIKKIGLRSSRFSKYCYGSAMLRDHLKKNSLKRNILLIKSIENEYLSAHSN